MDCSYCSADAVAFYLNDHGSKIHVCETCMEILEIGEWYGKNGVELSFDYLDGSETEEGDDEEE